MRLRNFILLNELILMLIPICIISAIVLNIMTHYLSDAAATKNDIIAHTMASHVGGLRNQPLSLLEQIRNSYLEEQIIGEDKIDAYMMNIIKEYKFFESMEMIDAQGRVKHAASLNKETIGMYRSGEEFYKEIKKGKSSYWSPVFISLQTKHPTMVLAIPMKDMVLVGYLNLEYISKISTSFAQQYGKDISVAIADEKGRYISHYDMEAVSQRQVEERFDEIVETDSKEGEAHTLVHTGQEMLISFEKMENPNWYILVYQSQKSAFSTIQTVRMLFFTTTIFAILGVLLFARYKTAYIMEAVKNINKQTDEIANGDYSSSVSYGFFTEFNQLIDHFNRMIEKMRDRDEKLHKLAYFDSLTGLANRMHFKEFLNKLINKKEPKQKSAILFIDLDNFKWINDTYGHAFGDELLRTVSNTLSSCVKEGDFLARLSGDEFVVILVDIANKSQVIEFLEKLKSLFEKSITIGGYTLYSGMSIGVAMYPDDSDRMDELLKIADTAMYYAKQSGKNNYQFYNQRMLATLQRKTMIEKALRTAVHKKEFELYYQPIIKANSGRIRGFEALIRWNSPKLGFVAPLDFIGIAEETGMILPIGKWVMKTACQKIAELNELYDADFLVAVNVSLAQFKSEDFISVVQEAIEESGIQPSQLELEITESILIDSFERTIEILKKVQSLGVRISLDDFGTGYSSLSYLRKLPINTVKIDKSFVSDVVCNTASKSLLEAIIVLAQRLQLSVVAEGVERQEQLNYLAQCNCNYVQGYFFSKPMPSNAVQQYYESYLKTNKFAN